MYKNEYLESWNSGFPSKIDLTSTSYLFRAVYFFLSVIVGKNPQ